MTAQFDQNDSQGQKVIIEDTRVRDLENDATLRPLSLIADRMRDLAAHVHPPVPNPAPLGLIAFGFTVALVMVKHSRIGGEETTEVKGVDSVTMGFALFFGGLLQVHQSTIAVMEFIIVFAWGLKIYSSITHTGYRRSLRSTEEQHLRVYSLLPVWWLLDVPRDNSNCSLDGLRRSNPSESHGVTGYVFLSHCFHSDAVGPDFQDEQDNLRFVLPSHYDRSTLDRRCYEPNC